MKVTTHNIRNSRDRGGVKARQQNSVVFETFVLCSFFNLSSSTCESDEFQNARLKTAKEELATACTDRSQECAYIAIKIMTPYN